MPSAPEIRVLSQALEQAVGESRVRVAVFVAFQFDPVSGKKIGYAASFLVGAIPFLDGLTSDNKRFIEDAMHTAGELVRATKFSEAGTHAPPGAERVPRSAHREA